MDFELTNDQQALQQTLSRYLRDQYPFAVRQTTTASETGWNPAFWRALATELGLLGAAQPESVGGLGGGGVENMVIMEELGRALAAEPYLSTCVIGGGFLRHTTTSSSSNLLQGIISGDVVIAFAHDEPQCRDELSNVLTSASQTQNGWVLRGQKSLVICAPWATHFMVVARTLGEQRDRHGLSLFCIRSDSSGIERHDYATADGARASQIVFKDVDVPAQALIGTEHEALAIIERITDEATAALCSEGVGCMRELLEQTTQYCVQRRQFGQPLAQFQSLQHRLADMHVALEQSVSAVLLATLKLETTERAQAVSIAKTIVSKSLRFIGQNAVQLHGGMGMTEELAIGHYFRRATMIEAMFGSADYHTQRYAQLTHTRKALTP